MNRLFDYTGRVALVTGAGQGMGLGIVRALATQGARVLLNDFYGDRAEAAAADLRASGLEVIAAPADITAEGAADALVALAMERYGQLDTLVNNAGVPLGMSTSLRTFDHLTSADFERQLDLNFRAVVALTRAVLPGMRSRQFGRIVTISSESWRMGQAMGLSDYAAAKAATIGFMRNLCKEVGPEGITVNVLSLGAMNNYGYDDIARKVTAVGRAGTPEDVGAAVAYLASNEASWMTGQVIPLNGGSATC
ncbi:MAG: SDR family NAD(P)-dependent oxidoreductase [Steroidobacteraceae bacterium]|jgi:NAD(P)-dependent dehydrogenase (short-subunit alcohol dehydrogenase family)